MDALFGLFQVLVALSLACVVAELWMWQQRDPEEQYQRQVDLMEAWAAEGPEALSDWRSFGFYGLSVGDFLRHRWAYYWEPALVNWLKGNDRVAPWPWQVRRWLIWNYGEAWHNFKVKAQNKLWKMGGDFDGDIQIVRAMEEVRMRVPEQDEADTWVVTVEVADANDAVDFYWHLRLYPSLDGMVREPLHRVDIHSSVGLVYALNEIYHYVGHEEEALLLALGQPDTVVARQPVELGVVRYDQRVQRLGWQLYEYYRNRQ